MARLSDAKVRGARSQALRSVRRAERSLDTKVEVMERRLDRSIENKDRITFTVLSSVISDYKSLIVLFRSLEVKITDAAILFQMTATKY